MPRGIPRDNSTQRQVLHRLKIARGHLDKVITMVDQDKYCIDIVHQSLAVQAALKKADQTLLENHIRNCVADDFAHGNSEQTVEELIQIIKKS